LARDLGRGSFLSLLLTIESCLPRPRALEVIPHVEAQTTQAVALELDPIAVLEAAQATVIGAGRQDVAGLERVDRRDPLDAARDLVRHVTGVEVLLQLAVHPQPHLELVRVSDLVGRHDPRADRRERVTRLHLVERVAGREQATGRAIDEVDVPEDVAHGVGGADVRRALADDHRGLGLALEDGGGAVRAQHGGLRPDDRARGLVERVDRRRLAPRSVFHVVHGHALDVDGAGQRRPDLDLAERHALAAALRVLEAPPVLGEALDQSADEIVRAPARDGPYRVRHVDDRVTLPYPQLEVVEEENLHGSLLCGVCWSGEYTSDLPSDGTNVP